MTPVDLEAFVIVPALGIRSTVDGNDHPVTEFHWIALNEVDRPLCRDFERCEPGVIFLPDPHDIGMFLSEGEGRSVGVSRGFLSPMVCAFRHFTMV